jgi:small subunit ribosomal protein S16
LYLKHLLRGVSLGLFDEAAAMQKFTEWTAEHDNQIKKKNEDTQRKRTEKRQAILSASVANRQAKAAAKAAAEAPAPEAPAEESSAAEAEGTTEA